MDDSDFRDSVSMNLLQIGELVGHLSEEYRQSTAGDIDWRAIRGMRNFFAHGYGAMDVALIWRTAIENVPSLSMFCQSEIDCFYVLGQESVALAEEEEDELEQI